MHLPACENVRIKGTHNVHKCVDEFEFRILDLNFCLALAAELQSGVHFIIVGYRENADTKPEKVSSGLKGKCVYLF
jgi:hypothetical protein